MAGPLGRTYIYDAMPKCQSRVPRLQPVGGLTTPTATTIIQLQYPPATQSPIYLVNNTKTWQDFWMAGGSSGDVAPNQKSPPSVLEQLGFNVFEKGAYSWLQTLYMFAREFRLHLANLCGITRTNAMTPLCHGANFVGLMLIPWHDAQIYPKAHSPGLLGSLDCNEIRAGPSFL